MKTTVDNFHAMRGHVYDGCIIVSPRGKEFTLKNTMRGWVIVGPVLLGLALTALALAYFDVLTK